jgi:hypothetical protein
MDELEKWLASGKPIAFKFKRQEARYTICYKLVEDIDSRYWEDQYIRFTNLAALNKYPHIKAAIEVKNK